MKFALSTFIASLFTLLLSFQAYAEGKESPQAIEGTTRVSAEDIFDLFDEYDDLVIIDSRKPADREPGYIEGSLSLPDFDTTPATLAANIATKSTPVVFYCNGPKCGRSVKASKMAVAEGYENVFWFRGGWQEWSDKGLPAVKD
ncbi:MAG: rhodanese-like domain-containing protein [Cellvibrionaceae bacterium]|nr:rhodanese-like domain-containing protein [Cellvibrionaceae bacterium]